MASYVDSVLMQGEEVIHRGKVSLLSMLPAIVGGGLLLLMGLVMLASGGGGFYLLVPGALWIGIAWIRRVSTELAVTNKRVIAKSGLISRDTVEMNLSKVESVRVQQSIVGRILGYGSIIVGGTGATHAPVPFIANPMAFKQAVTQATDVAQAR